VLYQRLGQDLFAAVTYQSDDAAKTAAKFETAIQFYGGYV
jgi:hypothetical protein